jgi:hypothetical protein
VYCYAQKFNSLCQYGGHHVDTDAKKMERFWDGLDGKLYEWLNLLEPENFHELVNKAISQEDAMKKAHRDKQRPSSFAPVAGLTRSFALWKRMFQTHPSNLQLDVARWSHPRANPQGTSSSAMLSSRLQSLMHPLTTLVIVVVSIVVNQGITSVIAPNPRRSSPTHRIKEQGTSLPLRLRSLWCKYAKASWTSPP